MPDPSHLPGADPSSRRNRTENRFRTRVSERFPAMAIGTTSGTSGNRIGLCRNLNNCPTACGAERAVELFHFHGSGTGSWRNARVEPERSARTSRRRRELESREDVRLARPPPPQNGRPHHRRDRRRRRTRTLAAGHHPRSAHRAGHGRQTPDGADSVGNAIVPNLGPLGPGRAGAMCGLVSLPGV